MKKIIGLDMGERRIGVAISDGLGMLAHPLVTLKWEGIKKFIDDLKKIIKEYDVNKLVVGIPYTMKGTFSRKTDEIMEIVLKIRTSLEIEVIEMDERLTTKMAENALHTMGKKPSRNRNKIDQIAAVYILQTYLDKIKP